MNRHQLYQLHLDTCHKALDLMQKKNLDYGSGRGANEDPFANLRGGEFLGIPATRGVLVRVLDKVQRLNSFIENGTLAVKDESAEDTILDTINYAILLLGLIIEERELKAKRAAHEAATRAEGLRLAEDP